MWRSFPPVIIQEVIVTVYKSLKLRIMVLYWDSFNIMTNKYILINLLTHAEGFQKQIYSKELNINTAENRVYFSKEVKKRKI